MIHKYRAQFAVTREGTAVTVEAIQSVVRQWLGEKEPVPSGVVEQEGDYEFPSGALVSVRHDIVEAEEQWAVRYSRKDDRERLVWVVDVAAAHDGDATTLSIAMGIELDEQRVVPISRRIRPPALVARMAREFVLQAGCVINPHARVARPDDIAGLVGWLQSAERALPLVVVTVDPYSEHPLVNPDNLQRLVLGLGEVLSLSKLGGLRLTRTLESILGGRVGAKLWTVHSGAVRIYWPHLDVRSTSANPFAHKLWIPDERSQLPREFDDEIFAQLSWAAVHRRYDSWTDFRIIERKRDIEQLARVAAQGSINQGAHEEAARRLERDIVELRSELAAAQAELQNTRANCEEAWQQCRDLQAENVRLRSRVRDTEEDELDEELLELIDRARSDYGETLLFSPDIVIESREPASFWRGVLLALRELCKKDQSGELTAGHLSVSTVLPQLLEEHGHNGRRPKHGDTGIEKQCPVSGEVIHLRWRLHMRSGAPGESESIYWEPVHRDGTKRLLVGWIGRHPD